MAKLGDRVVYSAHEDHRTETVKGEKKLVGSVHHPEVTEFAGLVTRVHADGTCDLVIFPPNREPKAVDAVAEGDDDHEFAVLE